MRSVLDACPDAPPVAARAETPLRVTLWRGFREDRRFSMDIYAERLNRAVQATALGCQTHVHTPHLPRRFGTGPWAMRLARYVGYPWQVRGAEADVHHIVEPGYAQLLYVLDSARSVVTVHDVMPLVRWHGAIPGAPADGRPWLNLLSARALRRAAHIIAISENTRRDLERHAGCDASKITVIGHGIESHFRPFDSHERARARKRWQFPADGTVRVLVVGSAYYKNQSVAVEAFAKLRGSTTARLELVGLGAGGEHWTQLLRRFGLSHCARSIDAVSDGDMPEVYNCVDLLLFPSLYEGFGRPPLEAMACGIPAVVSNMGALPETVGDAALMCDPRDAEAIAEAMHRALFDSVCRADLISRGAAQSKRFSWDVAARRTAQVYRAVAHDAAGGH